MKRRSLVAVGFVLALAALGMVHASDTAAADANQSGLIEERVGHGGSLFHSKTQSAQSSSCETMGNGALVEERIGHGGSLFRRQTTGTCETMAKGALV